MELDQLLDAGRVKCFLQSIVESVLADRIYEAVRQHSGDTDQQDDITLLILKVREE